MLYHPKRLDMDRNIIILHNRRIYRAFKAFGWFRLLYSALNAPKPAKDFSHLQKLIVIQILSLVHLIYPAHITGILNVSEWSNHGFLIKEQPLSHWTITAFEQVKVLLERNKQPYSYGILLTMHLPRNGCIGGIRKLVGCACVVGVEMFYVIAES